MIYVYIGVGAVAALLVFSWVLGRANRRGLKTRIGEMEHFIGSVMRGGANGTRLRLRHIASRRYIDFVKLISRDEPTRYVMMLDRTICQEAGFAKAKEALEKVGIEFEVLDGPVKGSQRLMVECGQDVAKATQAAEEAFLAAYGLSSDAVIRAGIKGGLAGWRGASIGWDK